MSELILAASTVDVFDKSVEDVTRIKKAKILVSLIIFLNMDLK
tara:strand:+ start:137 stop:265 length:129 start_codon:yes stop_codon:yes gene_type:complete